MATSYKIINDPIYGLIKVTDSDMLRIIDHPFFQRLRRIKQMGLADFVYPGAVHTRFQHSIGAAHLMNEALQVLIAKGVTIAPEERRSACLGILLHDIGHGPCSHALEYVLIDGVQHEDISKLAILHIDDMMDGVLSDALLMLEHQHPKRYLSQLMSGQLDMDRMDYLNRDSFYSGVSEGVIGYDRILQMLQVLDNELVIEEKGIYSVEKFLIARSLMYWQVYLHKAVISTEKLLQNIIRRAKTLCQQGDKLFASPDLKFFLYEQIDQENIKDPQVLSRFMNIDDTDIMLSIKIWMQHADEILSTLCQSLINRRLYKLKLYNQEHNELLQTILQKNKNLSPESLDYYLVQGVTDNKTYSSHGSIKILDKAGSIKDITEVENAIISPLMDKTVQRYYIGYLPHKISIH